MANVLAKSIINKLFNYLPVLFSFLLPFGGNYLSLIIILWFISSWFCFDKQNFMEGLKNKWFLLLISFFIFHCVSALLSSNKQEALTSVEVKLSFLAFPYFIFLFKWEANIIKRMLTSFVSGGFFSLLFCIARATYYYFSEGVNYFFYSDFSFLELGAGYFSMYLLLGIVIVQLAYPVWFSNDKMNKSIRILFTALFALGIFLCASKAGLIALGLVTFFIIGFKFRNSLTIKRISIALATTLVLLFVAYKVIPAPFERIIYSFKVINEGSIDKTTGESTGVRILIWEQCIELVKENFLFGTGSGDANDMLHKKYEANGLTGALEHNLNTHNQFFQTFIGLGVFGFIILLISTFGALIYGAVKKNIFLTIFSLIIILNFSIESMLQTQAGNLFYVLFLCLFAKYNPLNLESENSVK